MKRKIVAVLCIALGIFALSGCGGTKQTEETQKTEEMELYIFNSKGEISDSLEELVADYEKESGVKVKLFNTQAGEDHMKALRSLMNEKVKPDIYTVQSVAELEEWESYDYVMDYSKAEGLTTEFKDLADNIPEELRLTTEDGTNYGVPYNIEGYGYMVDTQMISDIFGAGNKDKVLEDLRLCSYAEWENCIRVLGNMIDTGAGGPVTLNGNTYNVGGKTGLASKLTGVFAVAGSDSWTYGDHMLNVAVCSGLANVSQAQNATTEQVKNLKNAFVAYAKALDLKTTYAAGDSGHLTRSADMINSSTNSYDAAIKKFAQSKAIFFKNGNWTASSIAEIDGAVAERLTFLPVKLPVTDADIHVEGLTAADMNSTIPVFASMYYVINNKNDDEHKKAAQDFLVWLNTSETGMKYITEVFQFIPYNADPETTTVSNALGNSIIKYVNMGGTISNPYNGAPSNWGGNTVGTYILQNYLAKPVWDENDYNKIADYAVSQWVSMGGLE
jgi:raffinose/stachyose/melibiose transport system substrate-binding protein